jgi:hypothetical protein
MSSKNSIPFAGFAGLALAAWLVVMFLDWRPSASDLARLYQAGFARPAVRLAALAAIEPEKAAYLEAKLARARVVAGYNPERLRASEPFLLRDDGLFWPSLNDLAPAAQASYELLAAGGACLSVAPEDSKPWSVNVRSSGVRPDWSAASNLVAYYDLGRVWIADVQGRHFQSIALEPALEKGGALRFSADGTALEVYTETDGVWRAQDLYVLWEPVPKR